MMPRTPTALLATLALLSGAALSTALADDASGDTNGIGYYVGASLGISNVHQSFFDAGAATLRRFDASRTGWKVLAGVRPIDWLGAEVEYLDFGTTHLGPSLLSAGNPSAGVFNGGHASASAGAGFAVAYLPLPPALDLFGKVGFARLETRYSYSGNYPNTNVNCSTSCSPLAPLGAVQDNSDTGLALGVGAQMHLGPFAARLEGERLSGLGGTYLVSLGVTWAPP